jgi:hypothetical protein
MCGRESRFFACTATGLIFDGKTPRKSLTLFGKAVTLFLKGSIIKEYHPPEEDSDRTAKR